MRRALAWLTVALVLASAAGVLAADHRPLWAAATMTLAYLAVPRTLAAWPVRKERDR